LPNETAITQPDIPASLIQAFEHVVDSEIEGFLQMFDGVAFCLGIGDNTASGSTFKKLRGSISHYECLIKPIAGGFPIKPNLSHPPDTCAQLNPFPKKEFYMFRISTIILLGLTFSTAAWADDDDWDERGYRYPYYREDIIYAPPVVQYVATPVVEYVAPPVVEYIPVQPRYYATPPPVNYYDQHSPQGLVGGMVGSALGYELGSGDPLAAGLGAAAGAWVGNGGY